ncbi:unnamed protein product [Sympodiomycopsis kandeliae]
MPSLTTHGNCQCGCLHLQPQPQEQTLIEEPQTTSTYHRQDQQPQLPLILDIDAIDPRSIIFARPDSPAVPHPAFQSNGKTYLSDGQRRYILALPPSQERAATSTRPDPVPSADQVGSEASRLKVQHTYYRKACRNYLFHPNLYNTSTLDNITRVMDVGSGTGIWLNDFNQEISSSIQFHACDVDLSMISPSLRSNCIQHDVLQPFPQRQGSGVESIGQQETYDFVHAKLLIYALDKDRQWAKAVKNMSQLLRPGGILHLTDLNAVAHLPNPPANHSHHLDSLHPILRINTIAEHTMKYLNKDRFAGSNLSNYLQSAGLEVGPVEKFEIPFGKAALDRGFNAKQVEDGLRATTKAIEVLKAP